LRRSGRRLRPKLDRDYRRASSGCRRRSCRIRRSARVLAMRPAKTARERVRRREAPTHPRSGTRNAMASAAAEIARARPSANPKRVAQRNRLRGKAIRVPADRNEPVAHASLPSFQDGPALLFNATCRRLWLRAAYSSTRVSFCTRTPFLRALSKVPLRRRSYCAREMLSMARKCQAPSTILNNQLR